MTMLTDVRKQAVTGLTPPDLGEARIRVAWPSVARVPAVAALGRMLMCSWIGAPLAWLLLAPFYFRKILPGLAVRYTLTNRRLMIQRGIKPRPSQEVALADIDDVRVVTDGNSEFYRTGTLEIISKGNVVLRLPGVRDPESFRVAILNACKAWVPGKKFDAWEPAKAATN
ncbi:MAG: PH domain-containing protein [Gemmataceae bacterium]|nr:PH domain-containing protein [Gemmataceae bacterium]MDW8265265.1 PH domain-containing protein [Gemmataceae bacterium]